MSTVAAWLVAVAVGLPQPWHPPGNAPESPQERRDRVAMIARAVAAETATELPDAGLRLARHVTPSWTGWSHRDRALVVLVKLWYESGRFRRDVHAGLRRGDQGRSVCLAQAMRGPWLPPDLWRSLPGLDEAATRRCVRVAYAILGYHRARCASSLPPGSRWAVARAFAGYGTGSSCNAGLTFAARRAALWVRLRGR